MRLLVTFWNIRFDCRISSRVISIDRITWFTKYTNRIIQLHDKIELALVTKAGSLTRQRQVLKKDHKKVQFQFLLSETADGTCMWMCELRVVDACRRGGWMRGVRDRGQMRGVSYLSLSLLASQPRLSACYTFPSLIPSLVFLLKAHVKIHRRGLCFYLCFVFLWGSAWLWLRRSLENTFDCSLMFLNTSRGC